jgi:catechol 2,3-dioxygenase-like lactoylglutathione lyase family enzyme
VDARPTLDELVVADEPAAWSALGFTVDGDRLAVGATRLRLAGQAAGRGIVSWSLRGLPTTELDGLCTERSQAPPPEPGRHPLGALAIDHVVVSTPDFDRTVRAFEKGGLDLRRERSAGSAQRPVRMGFFRVGEPILELVEHPDAPDGYAPASFWGLVVVTEDLDAAAQRLGAHIGEAHDAVQPGRRIATVRPSAGVSPALALMSRGGG